MQKVTSVCLAGHDELFHVDDDAYRLLKQYLDHAKSRLGDDLDRDEVLHDLEQSIGEKLLQRSAAGRRVIRAAAVEAVLEEIGSVDTDASQASGAETSAAGRSHAGTGGAGWSGAGAGGTGRTGTGTGQTGTSSGIGGKRHLRRIREGEWIAGVCTGLAAYADIRVDWVRLIFIVLTAATAGMFALVYVVLMFALPVVETRKAYFDLHYG